MEEMTQTSKTFIWGMFGESDIQTFDRFSKLALVEGVHVTSLLSFLVQDYLKKNDIPGQLVGERDLMEHLMAQGFSVSKITLRNYRNKNKLVDDNGRKLWFTDGRNLCYHLEGCLSFFHNRKRLKESRQRKKAA